MLGQYHVLRGSWSVLRLDRWHHRPSLDRAIHHFTRAREELDAAHPDRPLILHSLGDCLFQRYLRDDAPGDLDEAIRLFQQEATLPTGSTQDRIDADGGLAVALRARFVRDGDVRDLDDAILAATRAIDHTREPDDVAITGRAEALITRYDQWADLGDLLAALRDARTPVTERSHLGPRLDTLIEAQTRLHEYSGDPDDLAAAVRAGREALRVLSPADPYRAVCAATLSAALRHSDTPEARAEAVPTAEESLRGLPPGHADRLPRLSILAMALMVRYDDAENPHDLRRAWQVINETATLATDGNRTKFLQQLSVIARRHHAVFGDPATLRQAEQAVREALTLGDASMRGALIYELAELCRLDPARHHEARQLLVDAVNTPEPALTMRFALRSAALLSEMAAQAGDPRQAMHGYRRVVAALQLAAWPGLRRTIREARLADVPPATDAAAQALAAGEPATGVELLEAGRSVLWSHRLDMRTDLATLEQNAPELAIRLGEISGWFERAGD